MIIMIRILSTDHPQRVEREARGAHGVVQRALRAHHGGVRTLRRHVQERRNLPRLRRPGHRGRRAVV